MEEREQKKQKVNLEGGEKKAKAGKKAAPKRKPKASAQAKTAEAKAKKKPEGEKPAPEVEEKKEPTPQDFEELLKLYENSLAEIREGELSKGRFSR